MSQQPDTHPADQPAADKRRPRRWVRRLVTAAVAYVFWCTALYLFQDMIIWGGLWAPAPSSATYPQGTIVISLDIDDGHHVEAWFIPAPGCDDQHSCPAVMFFHGNGELIDYQDYLVHGYHRLGWSVLLPEYRGFGRSGGKPAQRTVRSDAARFYDTLIQRADVDASRVIFHGRSLGGAVAADLASVREPAGLILQSTFLSIPAMAHRYLAPGFIAKDPFRTDRLVESLDLPLLIFHGTSDRVVPVAHGRALSAMALAAKYIEYSCAHNDLPPVEDEASYWSEINAFLSGAVRQPAGSQ